jgi:hypothetical protein|nr:MAG TPA_asm: hypothetical protein [Caudoviricetes sp.]
MKYRNIKNGSVIDISCILNDVDWKALEPSEPQPVEEPQENEDSSVEEPQAEEHKKPQKKTGKKG